MVTKRFPALPKLQHYRNFTIRSFSVISRTLVGGSVIPLQISSRYILLPQSTGKLFLCGILCFSGNCPRYLTKYYYYYYYYTSWEFFPQTLFVGLSLESESPQISRTLLSIVADLNNVVVRWSLFFPLPPTPLLLLIALAVVVL